MAHVAEVESAEDDSINFAVAHGVCARVAADRGAVYEHKGEFAAASRARLVFAAA